MKEFQFGSVRVQVLSADIIRLEGAKKGKFCDSDTFFIPNRSNYRETATSAELHGRDIAIGNYVLHVPEDKLAGITLTKDGKTVYKYKKTANSGELPALDKTPEVYTVSDTPRIVVPEGGYTYRGKRKLSGYTVEENVADVYLLLAEKDLKKLRKLYIELTGASELVRLSTLGSWNSKYFVYDEETAKNLILDFEKHNVPLDNMVIDTDWRAASDRGIGYDIDTKLFPDMKRFLDFAHSHGVEIMFNDHPEPFVVAEDLSKWTYTEKQTANKSTNVFDPDEVKYREENLQSLMELGLDTWWYDRNWHTHLVPPTPNMFWETFGLYLYEDVTRHFYQKKYESKTVYRRPVIMGNVVDIINGKYDGIKDSASHKYSIQWTGDITSTQDSLAQEVRNLVKGTNSCITYINSDCGGHIGNPEKEEFIRWMQFGTLSPIFRPHCTNSVTRFREPWLYDEETLDIVREYNNLRYRLLPVIYKNAYNNYVTGEPVFKALGWEYPEDKRALKVLNEYMLGNNILIAPVCGDCIEKVPAKCYVTPVKATFYDGTELKGAPLATAEWNTLEMSLNHTSPVEGVPVYNFSARFETVLKFDKNVKLYISSDDGATVYVDGEKKFEDKTLHSRMSSPVCVLSAGKEHKIQVEYFQAGGEAYCGFDFLEVKKSQLSEVNEIYLPAGSRWVDVFDGKVYNGGKVVKKAYNLNTYPVFVRRGALLPLAYEAKNTKEQKWNKLVYDFYPSKEAQDSGYLYEDDTETTAYKLGQYRKSDFSAKFNEKENAFDITLSAGYGKFNGDKSFEKREITVKYHLYSDVKNVRKVTVNGEEVKFKKTAKNKSAFPLNTGKNSPDSSCLIIKFKQNVSEDYHIKFYL